uniref:Uncharacterized protein n=1 Tax=Populus trichocarpa TaxID=3694 RepID=A0A2K1Y5J5_POPTR
MNRNSTFLLQELKTLTCTRMFCRIYSRTIKNRVSFRKAMKKAIELTEQSNTKGIQYKLQGVLMEKKCTRRMG